MTQEALRMALEALELCDGAETVDGVVIYTDKEIAAVKKALAQPEQEPVAWMHVQGNYKEPSFRELADDEVERGWEQYPLYNTPPQRNEQCNYPDCKCPTENPCLKKLEQPEQPKVRTGDCLLVGVCASEGHKIQPQRTWVGLTDKQTTQAIKSMPKGIKGWMIDWDLHDFSKAIEAKLKEKNT